MKPIEEGGLPPDEIYVYIRRTEGNITEDRPWGHRPYSALRVVLPEQIKLDKEYWVYHLVGRVKSLERIKPAVESIPKSKAKRDRSHPRAEPYSK